MESLVIYRDYTFSYSPSLMYPLRVWLMMCALCMREVGGWCLFSPVQQQQQTLTRGEAEGIGSLPATASDSSTAWVYFSYSPGCISQISKVDRGCSWRYWLVTGCRWVLCASDSCFLAAASIQYCTSLLWATFVVHAHCLSLPQGCTSLRFCIIDGLHQLPWLRFTEWRHIVAVTLMSQCHVLALVPSGNTPSWMNFSNPFLYCLTLFGF